ncbi:FUSC family protein [Actinacidiphila acididurans]|uniref:FUSC family protein n=1 Tax=Actinacidiphila acididurans TaxID=2784346 RepID=A0ABS2TPU5_9ACTN|nr:FUSC family protein [Actinacidiphila acididurans]MBM9505107.1 FUSC family protein [Actinacidiphila acididurans]
MPIWVRTLDPGRVRLRIAMRTIIAALAALLVTGGVARAAHVSGGMMIIATVVAVMVARTLHGASLSHRLSALAYVPVIGLLAAFIGRFMVHHPWPGAALYVAAVWTSRYLLRFGGTVRRLGRLALTPIIAVLVTPVPPGAAKATGPLWGGVAALIAVLCVIAVQTLFPSRPTREAAGAATDFLHVAARLRALPPTSPAHRRLARTLHHVALTADDRLAATAPIPLEPEPKGRRPLSPDHQPSGTARTVLRVPRFSPRTLLPARASDLRHRALGGPTSSALTSLSAALLTAESLLLFPPASASEPAAPSPTGRAIDRHPAPGTAPDVLVPADGSAGQGSAQAQAGTLHDAAVTTSVTKADRALDGGTPQGTPNRPPDHTPYEAPGSAANDPHRRQDDATGNAPALGRSPVPESARDRTLDHALDDVAHWAQAVREVRAGERPAAEQPAPARRPGGWRDPQPQARLSLQMAAAMAAAFALGHLVFHERWAWTVITAFVVSVAARGRGDVVHRSGLRVAGAFTGAVTGTLVAHLVAGTPVLAVAVIFGYLLVGLWLRDIGYAVWAFCVTSLLAVLYSLNGEHGSTLLVQRPESILIGSACGIAAAFFVLPLRTETVMRGRAARALRVLQDLVAAAREPAPRPADLHALARTLDRAVRDLADVSAPARAHRALLRHRSSRSSLLPLLPFIRSLPFPPAIARRTAPAVTRATVPTPDGPRSSHAADWADTLAECAHAARALAVTEPAELVAARAALGLTALNVGQVRRRLGHRQDAAPPRPVRTGPAAVIRLNTALAELYRRLPASPASVSEPPTPSSSSPAPSTPPPPAPPTTPTAPAATG